MLLRLVLLAALAFPGFAHAADGASFDPLPVYIQAKAVGGGVPVGTVVAWPSYGMPIGNDAGKWLECNGQSTAGYPELAAVVGGVVPNYQGVFLRGYGGQASYHYGGVWHASNGLGVLQGDAIRNITGEMPSDLNISFYGYEYNNGALTTLYTGTPGFSSDSTGGVTRFNAGNVVPTAQENRPVNIAVRYLIRAKP